MCGAYGWISEISVEAANATASGSAASRREAVSLSSSIAAATAVLKWKRSAESRVDLSIAQCALRASASPASPSPSGEAGEAVTRTPPSARPPTSVHSRCRKR